MKINRKTFSTSNTIFILTVVALSMAISSCMPKTEIRVPTVGFSFTGKVVEKGLPRTDVRLRYTETSAGVTSGWINFVPTVNPTSGVFTKPSLSSDKVPFIFAIVPGASLSYLRPQIYHLLNYNTDLRASSFTFELDSLKAFPTLRIRVMHMGTDFSLQNKTVKVFNLKPVASGGGGTVVTPLTDANGWTEISSGFVFGDSLRVTVSGVSSDSTYKIYTPLLTGVAANSRISTYAFVTP